MPMPKRDCRDHHHRLATAEAGQRGALLDRAQAGVERQRGDFLRTQFLGHAFGFRSAAAVNDAGFACVGFQEGLELGGLAGFGLGSDVQIGAVKTGRENMGAAHVQR